jgi:hypothetical protein
LILVGTVHRDSKGFQRLLAILGREVPDFITVEISPYALRFREKHAPGLQAILRENLRRIQREEEESYRRCMSHGEIQGIFRLLRIPFEWRAAKAYAQQHQIACKAIDLSKYSKEKLNHVSELIHFDNLLALLQIPRFRIDRKIDWEYQRARDLWDHPPKGRSIFSEEIEEREAHMAGEIHRLMEEDKKRRVLHVGGWEHLLEMRPKKSLFTRLENFNPCRLLLVDRSKKT